VIFLEQGQRAEAECLLETFEAEAASMPADHRVHDDLEWKRNSVYEPRRMLILVESNPSRSNCANNISSFLIGVPPQAHTNTQPEML
jgi:hypothetical protein